VVVVAVRVLLVLRLRLRREVLVVLEYLIQLPVSAQHLFTQVVVVVAAVRLVEPRWGWWNWRRRCWWHGCGSSQPLDQMELMVTTTTNETVTFS
jgi:hypothetical protein